MKVIELHDILVLPNWKSKKKKKFWKVNSNLSAKCLDNSSKLTASSIFLPMISPKLYQAMVASYKQQYESVALGSYLKHAERMHSPLEKSPKDYIVLFNAKGFYFVRGKDGFEVKSIYTDDRTSFALSKRTGLYLNSIHDVTATLKKQQTVVNGLVQDGRNNLKNLWAGHLMERGMYDRAAFMLTKEKIYPNLHPEMLQHHMENGLRKSIIEALKRDQDQLLCLSKYSS